MIDTSCCSAAHTNSECTDASSHSTPNQTLLQLCDESKRHPDAGRPWNRLLRLHRSAAFSARERLREIVLAHEHFVAGDDKRQLVRLGISLQGIEASAYFDEHRVMKLALLQ
jgi:hypothetical protein